MQLPGRRINYGENLYTPWFSRGGDSMLLRIETLKTVFSSGMALSVKVETKNEDEPVGVPTYLTLASSGTALDLATSAGDFAIGLYLSNKAGTEGTKQQLRLVFAWTAGTAPSNSDYADIRVLAPVLFDAAKVN